MIEIIPKAENENFFQKNGVQLFAFLFLLLAVLAYAVFSLLSAQTEKSIQKYGASLQAGATSPQRELERNVLFLQRKMADFASFVRSRKDPLAFFTFVEKYTLPRVFFSDAQLNVEDGSFVLQGETTDFTTLEQQMLLFKQQDALQGVRLTKLDIGEKGQVIFTLELAFSPKNAR